jgi:hypothetical protein
MQRQKLHDLRFLPPASYFDAFPPSIPGRISRYGWRYVTACGTGTFPVQGPDNYGIFYLFIFSDAVAQRGLWSPPRGFLITQNDAPQSVGLLWTSDQLVAETST